MFKGPACLLVVRVAIIVFTVSNGMILMILRSWSDKECRLIRYVCLFVGKTGRSTQGALMFIIVCGCMLVSMWRGVFCQCGCVTVAVRDSRVNGVIFVETGKMCH